MDQDCPDCLRCEIVRLKEEVARLSRELTYERNKTTYIPNLQPNSTPCDPMRYSCPWTVTGAEIVSEPFIMATC